MKRELLVTDTPGEYNIYLTAVLKRHLVKDLDSAAMKVNFMIYCFSSVGSENQYACSCIQRIFRKKIQEWG
jgi:hypothetical protein